MKTKRPNKSIKIRPESYDLFWAVSMRRSKADKKIYIMDVIHEAAKLVAKKK